MSRKKIITILIFITGIIILLYPIVSKVISYKNQSIAILKYTEKVDLLDDKEKEEIIEKTDNLNKEIYEENIFNSDENKIDTIDFLKDDEVIAYINIPKINVNLPIYEGTSDKILNLGVGHIKNTSYPTKNINTHCILVGHTGLTKAKIFDDLDKLVLGDVFYINYLGENLKYKITEINTVLPEDTKKLEIEENKNKVTLVTCTPKHINTHRLLVTAEREEINNDEIKMVNDKINNNSSKTNANLFLDIVGFFFIILIVISICFGIVFIGSNIFSLIKFLIKKIIKK